MIGGTVLQVRHDELGLVVHCVDGHDEAAIHIEESEVKPLPGDKVWWQGEYAMLTSAARGYFDKRLKRIGYSFDPNGGEHG